jgi:hypothetical protein
VLSVQYVWSWNRKNCFTTIQPTRTYSTQQSPSKNLWKDIYRINIGFAVRCAQRLSRKSFSIGFSKRITTLNNCQYFKIVSNSVKLWDDYFNVKIIEKNDSFLNFRYQKLKKKWPQTLDINSQNEVSKLKK